MEVATLSTKGQIVIPKKLRKGFRTGKAFVVSKFGEMIVLKPVHDLTDAEKAELKELGRIWDEIDKGKADTYSEKEFFSAMKRW